MKKYYGIENNGIEILERTNEHGRTNKRGRTNYSANRMIVMSTVRSIKMKLVDKDIQVSYGSILNLRPFFVTYATEKELSLCMCKLCLNVRLLFEPQMARAKKEGDEPFDSVSLFLMHECICSKPENGYYQWACSSCRCKACHNSKPATLTCMSSRDLVNVDQFEEVEKGYLKLNKKTNEVEKCTTRLRERVSTQMTSAPKIEQHKEGIHHVQILCQLYQYGEITHSDYSENLSQINKYEAQACHFNKQAYSLYCTVEHVDTNNQPNLKSPYRYLYHLADNKMHDFAFTFALMVMNKKCIFCQ